MSQILYLNTPRMGSPFCSATLLFISRTAAAPSLTWLELPKARQHMIKFRTSIRRDLGKRTRIL